MHLLLNFLESAVSFRTNESWVPICMPKFNDGGYLYAYLCFLTPAVSLLIISTDKESQKFYQLADWKKSFEKVRDKYPRNWLLTVFRSESEGFRHIASHCEITLRTTRQLPNQQY